MHAQERLELKRTEAPDREARIAWSTCASNAAMRQLLRASGHGRAAARSVEMVCAQPWAAPQDAAAEPMPLTRQRATGAATDPSPQWSAPSLVC